MKSARTLRIVTVMLAVGMAPLAAAQMNKCVDKDGRVTYQQRPCDGAVVVPQSPPGAAVRPEDRSAGTAGTQPLPDGEQAIRTQAYRLGVTAWCEESVPGYRERNAQGYARWRADNAELLRKIDASPAWRAEVQRGHTYMAETFSPSEGRNRCPPYAAMATSSSGARNPSAASDNTSAQALEDAAITQRGQTPLSGRELALRDIAVQVGMLDWCSANVTGFTKEYGPRVDAWRLQNRAAVREIESDSAYRAAREQSRKNMTDTASPLDRMTVARCAQMVVVLQGTKP